MKRALLLVLAASTAHAEPPLAELEDDAAVARQLAQITSDPALPTLDLRARSRATALLKEGVAQVRAAHYEQGLANFLAAYDVFPSPRILMNIGSTLFDMRRYADAANTYQRYLFDPIAQKERLAEVKALLTHLDDQLTILTIRVYPASSQLSIDGGPFMHVEHALQTRVRPGPHTVRVHKDAAAVELTLNGFEGESKELVAQLPNAPIDAEPPAPPQREWLKAGRAYTSDGDHIRVNTGFGGPVLPPSHYDDAELAALTASVAPVEDRIDSGVIAIARIDGKGRGVAGGFGIAIARDHLEGDLMVLRSRRPAATSAVATGCGPARCARMPRSACRSSCLMRSASTPRCPAPTSASACAPPPASSSCSTATSASRPTSAMNTSGGSPTPTSKRTSSSRPWA